MSIFKAPKFWNNSDSYIGKLLAPISMGYEFLSSVKRNRLTPEKVKKPVVCVGNIVCGGAGKTPTVELLCNILKKIGLNPHILSSGYGGYLKNVVRVDLKKHSYLQVGDEALLCAEVCPTWIGKNRFNSADAAILSGADVLVMDDGLQNNAIEKNFKVLVVDSMQGFGNEKIFPAGPLRESVQSGVKKSDVVLIIGEKNTVIEDKIRDIRESMPIFHAQIEIYKTTVEAGDRVIGFCGLGYPPKFKKTLSSLGLEITDFISFSDHHSYTITEIQKLIKASQSLKAKLVTTRKDYVKIPEVFKTYIETIDVKLSPSENLFEDMVIDAVRSFRC